MDRRRAGPWRVFTPTPAEHVAHGVWKVTTPLPHHRAHISALGRYGHVWAKSRICDSARRVRAQLPYLLARLVGTSNVLYSSPQQVQTHPQDHVSVLDWTCSQTGICGRPGLSQPVTRSMVCLVCVWHEIYKNCSPLRSHNLRSKVPGPCHRLSGEDCPRASGTHPNDYRV